jgi:hypothetical protein
MRVRIGPPGSGGKGGRERERKPWLSGKVGEWVKWAEVGIVAEFV